MSEMIVDNVLLPLSSFEVVDHERSGPCIRLTAERFKEVVAAAAPHFGDVFPLTPSTQQQLVVLLQNYCGEPHRRGGGESEGASDTLSRLLAELEAWRAA